MKKILLVIIAFALPALSHAAGPSTDGCGLGWEITDKETMMGTTTRSTTNAFVPPTFGMTSGTIGCKQISFAKNETEAVNYVGQNFLNLKEQLAVGQGEYVEALTEVMGCGAGYGAKVQSKYNTVVAPATNGVELYKNLKSVCAI